MFFSPVDLWRFTFYRNCTHFCLANLAYTITHTHTQSNSSAVPCHQVFPRVSVLVSFASCLLDTHSHPEDREIYYRLKTNVAADSFFIIQLIQRLGQYKSFFLMLIASWRSQGFIAFISFYFLPLKKLNRGWGTYLYTFWLILA